ncbi:unnamed protein product [Acidithrix sp. C25]|nr:unnamed protein product [Acidithrix sp. C25]
MLEGLADSIEGDLTIGPLVVARSHQWIDIDVIWRLHRSPLGG